MVPITVAVTVAWPAYGFRFLLPLLPFVLLYFGRGAEAFCRSGRGWQNALQKHVLALTVCSVLTLNVCANGLYIASLHGARSERPAWLRVFEENESLIQWLGAHVPGNVVVATSNPALVHLYTELKTVGLRQPGEHWEMWRRMGVRYGAVTSWHPLNRLRVLTARFRVLYQSPRMNLVVLDFGEPANRVAWIDDPAERWDWDVW